MRINYPETWSANDRHALDEKFREARERGLWFYHQSLAGIFWFTAEELQIQQNLGKFVWGAVNWKLRHPSERVVQITQELNSLNEQISKLEKERDEVLVHVEKMGV